MLVFFSECKNFTQKMSKFPAIARPSLQKDAHSKKKSEKENVASSGSKNGIECLSLECLHLTESLDMKKKVDQEQAQLDHKERKGCNHTEGNACEECVNDT